MNHGDGCNYSVLGPVRGDAREGCGRGGHDATATGEEILGAVQMIRLPEDSARGSRFQNWTELALMLAVLVVNNASSSLH